MRRIETVVSAAVIGEVARAAVRAHGGAPDVVDACVDRAGDLPVAERGGERQPRALALDESSEVRRDGCESQDARESLTSGRPVAAMTAPRGSVAVRRVPEGARFLELADG